MSVIKGKHAVLEALRSGAKLDRVVMDSRLKTAPDCREIITTSQHRHVKLQFVSKDDLQRISEEAHTQGILGYLRIESGLDLNTILDNPSDYPFLVAIDHIEDPFNFGAIIRTSEVLGVNALLYPKDRNVQLTPGVIKASSGATAHLPLIKITNLAQTIDKLKEVGYWVYGTHESGEEALSDFKPNFPMVLIVGNEHKGQS